MVLAGAGFLVGEAPEQPEDWSRAGPQKRRVTMRKAYRRAEPWPATDHGSARSVTTGETKRGSPDASLHRSGHSEPRPKYSPS